ncbi:MAG: carbohydrate ABC transporter permease [Clostridia bacterium]
MQEITTIKMPKTTMRGRRIAGNVVYNAFMLLLCTIIIFPLIWTFASAFKTSEQIYSENPLNLIPDPFTLFNFSELNRFYPVGQMVFNGLYLSIVIPLFSMIVSSMAAYALARLEFKGKNVVFMLLISTMMIPSYVTLIPNFMIMVNLHLIDTHWALILRSGLSGSATAIFLFRQYFLSIPKDLENAAIIDGCSWFGVFFRVVIPNSKPVLATVAILTFRSTWNAYLWPSLVLNTPELMTWTLGLKLLSDADAEQALLIAGSAISILPILIIYIFFQKYFTNSQVGTGFAGT